MGGLLLLLLERQLGQRGGLIGQPPRDQLVGDDPERVQVGAGARLLAARLLGREVGGGAENGPDLGDARLLGGLGDAEVRQLDLAFARAQQVAGLDVAVDHAVAVGVVQPLACLLDDRDRLVHLDPAVVAQDLRAGGPLDVLHHDEVLAGGLILAGVEDLHDVGVDQARRGLCLALEARHERGVLGEVLGEQLHRDLALQAQVEGEVNGGHPAEAEPALQAVAPGDLRRCSFAAFLARATGSGAAAVRGGLRRCRCRPVLSRRRAALRRLPARACRPRDRRSWGSSWASSGWGSSG